MTSRTSYKPEGWPTAGDLALTDAQHAVDLEHEIYDARDIFERLIAEPFASEYANQRLVVAYRALKAWEATPVKEKRVSGLDAPDGN